MLTNVNSGRQRGLVAALAVLRDDGIDAVTMRAVAERAGVTATALYRHFDDKDALLREVVREVGARFKDRMTDALAEESAEGRLLATLDAFRAFAVEEPHYFALLFMDSPAARARAAGDESWRRSAIFQLLTDRVAECMKGGALREDDPASVALTVAALARGLVALHHRGRFASPAQFAEFYRTSFARLLDGLR